MRDPRDGAIGRFEKPVLGVLMLGTVACVALTELRNQVRRLNRALTLP